MSEAKKSEFESLAAKEDRKSMLSEVWGFLGENKKWWLLPIIVALLILGVLVLVAGTGLAPFVYTIF